MQPTAFLVHHFSIHSKKLPFIYVPAEWLKKGSNEIIVFEMLKPEQNEISAINKPILSKLQ